MNSESRTVQGCLLAADAFSRSDTLHSQAAVRTSAAERGRSEARRGRDQGIASETVVGRRKMERRLHVIYSPRCCSTNNFYGCAPPFTATGAVAARPEASVLVSRTVVDKTVWGLMLHARLRSQIRP